MLLSRKDNDMSQEEVAAFMRKLKKSKVFHDVQKKGADQNLPLTKKGVVRLFVKGDTVPSEYFNYMSDLYFGKNGLEKDRKGAVER